ncbi:M23 family metallopeptidase [Erythrobacter sp. SDW2]|uniref:M23 family metallopeptidase n=1 Tax=Erythrobacter sp. SDW2 TaxID=2907154 RepID=UPI001F4837D6|nr:M23 family metallopeptidase [Erythrobacter sp. SDW2]UIP08278.1 M23 family metallopeptidase [Erythrobacter sp. SDW2]
MRSQGQVRFIKVSSRVQKLAAAGVVVALLVWAVSMGAMSYLQYRAQADRMSLLEEQARVATAQERIQDYGDDLNAVAEDLEKRQDFLEAMTPALPDDIKIDGEDTVSDSSTEAAKTVEKVSAAFPQARALAELEARQLAYVERLTRFADLRAARAAQAIRQLGLNPQAMLAGAEMEAMGGPLELLATGAKGEIDPRFERLGLSLARMSALERSLEGIPQVLPASAPMVTSSFGYRRDPFTGRGAMHSGLDFKGPIGAPIYAAAKGVVTFVGRKSGYGNVVEVSHGNGLMTRYAHMSRFATTVGTRVEAGDIIGAIGSTGRSTGPHLHFEVRINGRAIDPRPFLKAAPNVLKEVRRTGAQPAKERTRG